jgi:hypothetical protein
MPDFVAWTTCPKTGEFGVQVRTDGRNFSPQADGSLVVTPNPQTKFYDAQALAKMAEVAGEGSKPFWTNLQKEYPMRLALHENGVDMTQQPEKPAASGIRVGPAFRPTEFNIS